MTKKRQKQLLAQVDAINKEWHDSTGERRGELKEQYESLIRQSDTAEALRSASSSLRSRAPSPKPRTTAGSTSRKPSGPSRMPSVRAPSRRRSWKRPTWTRSR
jgi:hypothetical protein